MVKGLDIHKGNLMKSVLKHVVNALRKGLKPSLYLKVLSLKLLFSQNLKLLVLRLRLSQSQRTLSLRQ